MKTIAIYNQKGGVAKTTTALALGAGLMKKGFSVLFIDLDNQCNLSTTMGADTTDNTSYSLLSGRCRITDCVQITDMGDIIPASTRLSMLGDELADFSSGRPVRDERHLTVLKRSLAPMGKFYDYVIIDISPTNDIRAANMLTAADYCIVPVNADEYSYIGIHLIKDFIDSIKGTTNPGLRVMGLLVTRIVKNRLTYQRYKKQLKGAAEILGTTLFDTKIRECTALTEAAACHMNIYDYMDDSKKKGNGAFDYERFTEEVIERSKR